MSGQSVQEGAELTSSSVQDSASMANHDVLQASRWCYRVGFGEVDEKGDVVGDSVDIAVGHVHSW